MSPKKLFEATSPCNQPGPESRSGTAVVVRYEKERLECCTRKHGDLSQKQDMEKRKYAGKHTQSVREINIEEPKLAQAPIPHQLLYPISFERALQMRAQWAAKKLSPE